MVSPSCISSSDSAASSGSASASGSSSSSRAGRDRPPRAGALALAAILLIDRLVFGVALPWEWLAARVPESHMAESGIARDQAALARLARAPAELPRVFVLGSSRAEAGFRPDWLPAAEKPRAELVKLAHPGLRAFELRSLVDEIAAQRPRVAVLLLSEFEIAHPLDLKAGLSSGSFSALGDLLRAGGARFAFESRGELYRLAAVGLLASYRFRDVLGSAGLDALRKFPLDARLQRPEQTLDWLLAPGERVAIPEPLRRRVQAEIERALPAEARFPSRVEMQQIYSLSRGAHLGLQEQLLRRSVERLRAAGAQVILVEMPLFPGAAPLYDAGLRDAFAAFAADLAGGPGVRFVPLEAGAFGPGDFKDLTHLARPGAEKLTRQVLRAVDAALAPSPGARG